MSASNVFVIEMTQYCIMTGTIFKPLLDQACFSTLDLTYGNTTSFENRWLQSVKFKYKPGCMTCYKFKCSYWWKIYFLKKSFTRFALQPE